MNKTIITSLVILTALSNSAFGQRNKVRDADFFPRNEIYIQYGAPTIMELATTLNSKYKSVDSDGGKYEGESKNHKFSGVGGIGYNFFINEKFAVGLYGGVSYASADLYLNESSTFKVDEPIFLYRSGITSYTGQIALSWIYYYHNSIELSSAAYFGASYCMEDITVEYDGKSLSFPSDQNYLKFAYHITALKFRYGETFGVLAEVGFGYRGLVNVGLSVRL